MSNKDIRERARIENVKYWMIAHKLGIAASTFTVWLRSELPEEKKRLVMGAIDDLIHERKEQSL